MAMVTAITVAVTVRARGNKMTDKKLQPDELADDAPLAAENTGKSKGGNVNLEAVYDVPVQVSAVLGKTKLPINKLLALKRGDVVELDQKVGEAVEIFVNDKLVAKGEIVISGDKLAVTMTDIIKS